MYSSSEESPKKYLSSCGAGTLGESGEGLEEAIEII